MPKARQAAVSALRLDPAQQEAAYVLARLYLSIGEVKRAADMLNKHLDRDDPNADVLALLAGLQMKAEAFAEATKLYELGRKKWPDESRWLKALAKLHLQSKQEEQLADVLKELAVRDNDNVTLTKKLADLALNRGEFQEAADWANQSLHVTVKDADLHALLGQALVELDKLPQAIAAFQTALTLDPSKSAWRFMLADAHVQADQFDEAKIVLNELISRDPEYPGAATLLESLERE